MEKMTIRIFLENVIKAGISDEMTDFARERIAKLDEKNEKKKSATSAKKVENADIKTHILEIMGKEIKYKASEIGEMMGISTQKASALLKQMENDGILESGEERVKGKGKVKVYMVIKTEELTENKDEEPTKNE